MLRFTLFALLLGSATLASAQSGGLGGLFDNSTPTQGVGNPVGAAVKDVFGSGGSFNPVGDTVNDVFGSSGGSSFGGFGGSGGVGFPSSGPSRFTFPRGSVAGWLERYPQLVGRGRPGRFANNPGGGPFVFVNPDAVPFNNSFGVIATSNGGLLNQIRRQFDNQSPPADVLVLALASQMDASLRERLRSGLSAEAFAAQTGSYTSEELRFKSFDSAAEMAQALALSRATREVLVGLQIHQPNPGGGLPMLALLREIESRLGLTSDSTAIQSMIDLLEGMANEAQTPELGRQAAMATVWPAASALLMTRAMHLLHITGTAPSPQAGGSFGSDK